MKHVAIAAVLAALGATALLPAVAAEPAAKPAPAAAKVEADFPLAAARAKSPGEAAFLARCQYCHLEMGFGTLTLTPRLGPKQALLANRSDLEPDFIKTVVRSGLNTMPPISRVEVSDAELELIVDYLTRTRPDAKKSRQ